MKTVKFSELELEFMQQMYLEELTNAEIYVRQIKDILKKLGIPVQPAIDEPIAAEPEKTGKRRGRKKQSKPVEPKEPKKRGRKPKKAVSGIIDSLVSAKQTEVKDLPVTEPVASHLPDKKPVQKKDEKVKTEKKGILKKAKKGKKSSKTSKPLAKKVPAAKTKADAPVIPDAIIPVNEGI